MEEKDTVWLAKQEWFKRIKASSLTPATKIFVWEIFDCMYGEKITSNPGTEYIAANTHLNRSKFTDYRGYLFGCRALTGTMTRSGRHEHWTYTLNLDWDGSVPLRQDDAPEPATGSHDSPALKSPQGTRKAPEGTCQGPTGDEQGPRGCSNTSSNTSREKIQRKKPISDTRKRAPQGLGKAGIDTEGFVYGFGRTGGTDSSCSLSKRRATLSKYVSTAIENFIHFEYQISLYRLGNKACQDTKVFIDG